MARPAHNSGLTREPIAVAEKTPVSAKRVLADLKAGISDSDLKAKYGLTSRGLQSLFRKLVVAGLVTDIDLQKRLVPERPSVDHGFSLKSFVDDIKAGLPDEQLMRKYQLSPRRLHRVLKRLISVGLIDGAEIDRRLRRFEEPKDDTAPQELKDIDDMTEGICRRIEAMTLDE